MTTKRNSFVEKWKNLPWLSFNQDLFRLQHRVYKATQKGDYYRVKKLHNLILGSAGARYLKVRQVTQLNLGKIIAGTDVIKYKRKKNTSS
jgi:RNA-directed DNA polymerase